MGIRKVLVIDDEIMWRKLLGRLLPPLGCEVAASGKEALAAGAENIYGRDALIEAVWNNAESDLRTVDTHICSLRSKLGRLGEYIVSEKGVGYGISRRKRL